MGWVDFNRDGAGRGLTQVRDAHASLGATRMQGAAATAKRPGRETEPGTRLEGATRPGVTTPWVGGGRWGGGRRRTRERTGRDRQPSGGADAKGRPRGPPREDPPPCARAWRRSARPPFLRGSAPAARPATHTRARGRRQLPPEAASGRERSLPSPAHGPRRLRCRRRRQPKRHMQLPRPRPHRSPTRRPEARTLARDNRPLSRDPGAAARRMSREARVGGRGRDGDRGRVGGAKREGSAHAPCAVVEGSAGEPSGVCAGGR